mmetsp:Transcript_13125/g.26191  ORF Transcript_13125/g.26191 Transcript_13125/m.26191 type:complete len:180 (-) Transcript_13125:230-769(-)
MLLFKCRVTGDECLSDAFKPTPVLDADGEEVVGLIEIPSTQVNKDSGASIDIGCGNAFGEEAEADGAEEKVNNVIDETFGFGLQLVPMGKRDLKEYLGDYCKKVRQLLKDDDKVSGPEVKAFTQSAPKICKYLLGQHADLEFYITRAMDPEGAMAFAYYGEGVNPKFIFIEAGMIKEKC